MDKILGRTYPIDARNRVVIPKDVMRLLELKPKDLVFFRRDDNRVVLGKAIIKYEFIEDVI